MEHDTKHTSCNCLDFNKMAKVKKVVDEAREQNNPELDLVDRGITSIEEIPGLFSLPNLTRLTLSHNKIRDTLRALYLGDNEFEKLPPAIGQLKNLQILSVRENDLVELPKELGQLTRLRELHIQGNRLTLLPPELGNLDLASHRCVVRMDDNPWVAPIADQLQIGVSHVVEYIRSETYKYVYGRNTHSSLSPPPKKTDKNKKVSKKRDHN
ncbi:hypothetical protein HPB49_025536 [Dermacentor silvarum]|uniref:Uncharacterized protein n=1 Tax=Dermacentor silvarum TaxID=543639 RepID=A0ACB8CNB8_DERSI|nr:hypothetical protein HPB49_025536 [Dermacentor silvarum]